MSVLIATFMHVVKNQIETDVIIYNVREMVIT